MNKKTNIIYSLLALISSVFLSCTDEINLERFREAEKTEEREITFDLCWPETSGTRAYIDDNGNERFSNNDMIHVLGTFKTSSLDENGKYNEGVVTRYGALVYNGKNWVNKEGSELSWPAISVSGSFVAYYISRSNGVLTGTDPTETFSLSELTKITDPLIAQSEEDIPYGNGVKLQFSHICAFLTIENLEPQVSDSYWFIREGDDLKDQNGNPTVFNNAFQIGLKEGEYGPDLEFKFLQEKSSSYGGLVYIAGNRILSEETETNPVSTTSVEYFLEPGYYDTFQLVYPSTDTEVFSYIQYDYNRQQVVGESAPVAPLLEANSQYTLNITKSKGSVTVNNPFTDGDWDENGEPTIILDVKAFLEAATSGKSYTEDNNPILQSDNNGTTTLLRNIDFRFYDYRDLNGNYPNMPENVTFDGGQHYIQNLHDPLFRNNSGKIRNLGIRHVRAEEIISEENDDPNLDNSRNGALCHINNGIIDNIRARDVTLIVGVKSYLLPGMNDTESHNVGGIVGSNIGNINEVALGDNFSITVKNYVDNDFSYDVNASVYIGGVTGQNAGNGKITGISTLDNNLSIAIYNKCVGVSGNFLTGGIAGQSEGHIIGATLSNVVVDGTESVGVTSYMGGVAGQLTTTESDGSLENCIMSGSVSSGTTKAYGYLNSASYIGGIAGAVYNVPVIECRSFVNVTGPGETQSGVLYATGGAFGRIRNSSLGFNFTNLILWESSMTGPAGNIGNFAGIVPDSEGWDSWYSKFNSYNITVREIGTYDNIGEKLPD